MYVCVCKAIKASQIQEAMARGCTSVDAIAAELGLGTGCGTCVDYAQQFIEGNLESRKALAHSAA